MVEKVLSASSCVVFPEAFILALVSFDAADGCPVSELCHAASQPGVDARTPEYFRIVWADVDAAGLIIEAHGQGNLSMFEDCWGKYIVEKGSHEPTESTRPEPRGGRKYKVNIVVNETGLEHHQGGGTFMAARPARDLGT